MIQAVETQDNGQVKLISISKYGICKHTIFCNLANRKYTLIVADGLDPLSLITVEYFGRYTPQHVQIVTKNQISCLTLPIYVGTLVADPSKSGMYVGSLTRSAMHRAELGLLSLKFWANDISSKYDDRTGRVEVHSFRLSFVFEKI